MQPIFLIGFMGSGKSTIAEVLAKRLGVKVIDTDSLIVEQNQKSIPEIFEQYGEKGFRKMEANLLKELPLTNVIVSTGGGIVENENNFTYMKKIGTVVYLECPFDVIYTRINEDLNRPIAQQKSKQALYELYKQREARYQSADLKVNTNQSVLATVDEIIEGL